jgi:hypothetical protein
LTDQWKEFIIVQIWGLGDKAGFSEYRGTPLL